MSGQPLPTNSRVHTSMRKEADGRWSIRRAVISCPPGNVPRQVLGENPFGHGPYATQKDLRDDIVRGFGDNVRYSWSPKTE